MGVLFALVFSVIVFCLLVWLINKQMRSKTHEEADAHGVSIYVVIGGIIVFMVIGTAFFG